MKTFERGLIWALVRDPVAGFNALAGLDSTDLTGLATGSILEQARSLQGWPSEGLPQALLERLSTGSGAGRRNYRAARGPGARARRLRGGAPAPATHAGTGGRSTPDGRLLEQGIPSDDERINQLGMRQLVSSSRSIPLAPSRRVGAPRTLKSAGRGPAHEMKQRLEDTPLSIEENTMK